MEQKPHRFSIAVLLPTRGRTAALSRSVMSLVNRAHNLQCIQFMFGFDDDDSVGINHWTTELEPWLKNKGVQYRALSFEPIGYIRLNEYVTELAKTSDARWLMFWNDDAIMESLHWDQELLRHDDKFNVLAVHTHREHPYSIFPIVPRAWLELFGYMSPHQLSDAYISQVAYMVDIWKRIEVWVTHDRFDLTGNNNDDTFRNRPQLENRPNDPEDFHSNKWHHRRINDAEKLATYLRGKGHDMTWWDNVKANRQDPWEKLSANDVNKQMTQSKATYVPTR
jgi:hypothetical protein